MRLVIALLTLALGAVLCWGCEPSEGQPRKYPDATDTSNNESTDTDTSTNTDT
jgi:hypothetical protein